MSMRAILDKDAVLHLYLAGACSGRPFHSAGGWAWLAVCDGEHLTSDSGRTDPPTTRHRAELYALMMGTSWAYGIAEPGNVVVHAESSYLAGAVNKWLYDWLRAGWTRKDGDIAHLHLWKFAAAWFVRVRPTAKKLPRRSKDEYAKWCRDMAQAQADHAAEIERLPTGPYSRWHRRQAEAARAASAQRAKEDEALMEVVNA